MSDFLVLDWDEQQLIGLEAYAATRTVEVRKYVRFDWTDADRPLENPAAAGSRLRYELDRAGIGAPPVLVCLPREESVVRLLDFPDCSDAELPDLVRFQAATRSSVP